MRIPALALAMVVTALQSPAQTNSGAISGAVTRPGGTEGIGGVQITLLGPSQALAASGYTANPALTGPMRDQIDQLIASAPPGISPEVVANAAARMEAQLLGLAPPPAFAGAGTPVPQTFATTDADGRFSFRNLAPGRYQVRAQRDGYFGAPVPGATGAPAQVNSTATVVAGQPTPEIAFTMIRGSTVSGRVRDTKGQPLSNLTVMVYQLVYREGKFTLATVNSKQTDDRGEYRLFWLSPGDYYIGVNPPRPSGVPRPTDAYSRTYYPNADDPRAATRLTVVEGTELSSIDIGLRAATTVKVSGRVISSLTGPNGQPSTPAATFFLLPRDPNAIIDTAFFNFPNSSPNRNEGQFELRGVPPGSYDLIATAPDSTGRPFPGRTQIEVGYGDVDNVSVTIRRGVEVKAAVLMDGKVLPAPPPQPTAQPTATTTVLPPAGQPGVLRLQLRSKESYPSPFDTATSVVTSDASGAFVFPNVPASLYTVQVGGIPANTYVADIRENGVSIYDTGLRVTDQQPGMVEVMVNSGALSIQGTVSDAAGKPAAQTNVVLVPHPSHRQNSALYKTARTTATGTFVLNGLPPGEYKLFAWESVPATAYMNAEFISKYEASGQSISAKIGTNLTVQLTVIPNNSTP